MPLEALARRWSGTKDRPERPAAVIVWLASICAAVFATGVPRVRVFGMDSFIALDGAWRILNGERPVTDFLATIGPAWYLLYAGGLALAGGEAIGIAWSATFAAAVVAAWSYLLLRRRMASAPFLLACVSLTLLAAAPFALGLTPWYSTLAMTYNRYGFALTGLVLLECFMPPRDDRPASREWWGGVSTGLACSILLFVKISYGLVAIAIAGLSVLLRHKERSRVLAMAAGFLLFTVPMLAYLRFDIRSLVEEYRLLAAVRGGVLNVKSIARQLYADRWEMMPSLVAGALVALQPGIPPRRRVAVALVCLIAAAAGAVLILGNAQNSGLPLLVVAALLLVNEVTLALREGRASYAAGAPVLCLALAAILMPVMLDAAGIALALGDKLVRPGAGVRMRVPHMAAMTFVDVATNPTEQNENGGRMIRLVEEGMDLVMEHGRPHETVRGLTGMNPFPYALLRRPPRGGAVSITDRKVSETVVPPPDKLIGGADLLLFPKFPTPNTPVLDIVMRHHPELLGEMYGRAAESEHWVLYRRR